MPCVRSWHPREASLLARHVLQASVLLLIRWFRVDPLAPHLRFYAFTGRFVTGSWTDRIRSFAVAAFVLPVT